MHFLPTGALALGMLLLGSVHATPIADTELETRQVTTQENCAQGIHMVCRVAFTSAVPRYEMSWLTLVVYSRSWAQAKAQR